MAKVRILSGSEPATLIEKNITANGTYNASADDADGYSSVTVNVPGAIESVLWNNPNPTGDFSSQTVNLNDDIENYDYIKITYKRIGADTDVNDAIFPSVFVIDGYCGALPFRANPTQCAVRFFWYLGSDIIFTTGYNANTGASYDSYSIPIQIVGIKIN